MQLQNQNMTTVVATRPPKKINASENFGSHVWKVLGFPSTNGKITSSDVIICTFCVKYHSTTTNLRAHLLTLHAEESEEPQLAVAKAEKDVPLFSTCATNFVYWHHSVSLWWKLLKKVITVKWAPNTPLSTRGEHQQTLSKRNQVGHTQTRVSVVSFWRVSDREWEGWDDQLVSPQGTSCR